jgi:hypothetical protein
MTRVCVSSFIFTDERDRLRDFIDSPLPLKYIEDTLHNKILQNKRGLLFITFAYNAPLLFYSVLAGSIDNGTEAV